MGTVQGTLQELRGLRDDINHAIEALERLVSRAASGPDVPVVDPPTFKAEKLHFTRTSGQGKPAPAPAPADALRALHDLRARTEARTRAILGRLATGPATAGELLEVLPVEPDQSKDQRRDALQNRLFGLKTAGTVERAPAGGGWRLTAAGRAGLKA